MIVTFVSFAFFPLAVIAASNYAFMIAAAIGGLLWSIAPEVPFVVAGVIGLIGTLVFAATVAEQFAS